MNNRAADLKAVTHIDNVRLGGDEKSVVIIDQTKLPNAAEYLTLRTAEDFYDAIFELKVRGGFSDRNGRLQYILRELSEI